MELLNALLDLVDALLTAVGWVAFWCTWVAPPRPPLPASARPSDPDDLQRFLRDASLTPAAGTPA